MHKQEVAMYLTSTESEAEKKEITVYLEEQEKPELWKMPEASDKEIPDPWSLPLLWLILC